MQTCLQINHTYYLLSMLTVTFSTPVIKCCCCAIFGSCHIYPTCLLNWNSGGVQRVTAACGSAQHIVEKTCIHEVKKINPIFPNPLSSKFAVIISDPQTYSSHCWNIFTSFLRTWNYPPCHSSVTPPPQNQGMDIKMHKKLSVFTHTQMSGGLCSCF